MEETTEAELGPGERTWLQRWVQIEKGAHGLAPRSPLMLSRQMWGASTQVRRTGKE